MARSLIDMELILRIFKDGYDAYHNGLSLATNPHRLGTHKAEAWDLGWHNASRRYVHLQSQSAPSH